MHRFILLAVLGLSGCGVIEDRFECPNSHEEFDVEVVKAQECSPGDTCVIGGSWCTCGIPVNAAYAEEVTACTENLGCQGVPDCAPFRDLRCENGRCVVTRGF